MYKYERPDFWASHAMFLPLSLPPSSLPLPPAPSLFLSPSLSGVGRDLDVFVIVDNFILVYDFILEHNFFVWHIDNLHNLFFLRICKRGSRPNGAREARVRKPVDTRARLLNMRDWCTLMSMMCMYYVKTLSTILSTGT